jgi:hypothetical protein
MQKSSSELQLEREKFESDRKSERQKLDEDLIKLALQSPEIDKRKEALSFMVETGLIADSDIKQGVEHYLAQKKPIPALATSSLQYVDQLAEEADNLRAYFARRGEPISGGKKSPDGKSWFWLNDSNQIIIGGRIGHDPFSIAFSDRFALTEFSPDSSKLLVVTKAPDAESVDLAKIVDSATGKTEGHFFPPWLPDSANFTEDGKKIVLKHGNETLYYDLQGNEVFGP